MLHNHSERGAHIYNHAQLSVQKYSLQNYSLHLCKNLSCSSSPLISNMNLDERFIHKYLFSKSARSVSQEKYVSWELV